MISRLFPKEWKIRLHIKIQFWPLCTACAGCYGFELGNEKPKHRAASNESSEHLCCKLHRDGFSFLPKSSLGAQCLKLKKWFHTECVATAVISFQLSLLPADCQPVKGRVYVLVMFFYKIYTRHRHLLPKSGTNMA